jgi:hypothetical protein
MSLFNLFKKADPFANASANFRAFHRSFLGAPSVDTIREGLDESVFARLTPAERAEAERLLMARLAAPGDSRAAVGLGLLGARQAVAPLRRLIAVQTGAAFTSAAYAQALWRIERDPAAVEAVAAVAQNKDVQSAHRVEAVRALADMPGEPSRQALLGFLHSEPDYLMRYHSFVGVLMQSGWTWAKASEQAGALAPLIARMVSDAAARSTVLGKLAELAAPPAAG